MNPGKLFPRLSKAISSIAKINISFTSALQVIEHDVENKRFTMKLPLDTAYVEYFQANDVINLHYIFVPKRYRALGIGQDLARDVLDYCSENDIKVILTCPYLVTFYKQHPYPQFKKVVRGVAVPKKSA